jgi:hypothetical protein
LIAAWLLAASVATAAAAVEQSPSDPAPPLDLAFGSRLAESCTAAEASACAVAAIRQNDHVYIFPAAAGEQHFWAAACYERRGPRSSIVYGVPAALDDRLQRLPPALMSGWIAAGGPLDDPGIQTITFCGFEVANVLRLDWSATRARVRFDLVRMVDLEALPAGTVASRGIFTGGLSVDRSTLVSSVAIDDARFGAYVEVERSRIDGTLNARNTVIEGALRLRGNQFRNGLRLEAMSIYGDTIVTDNQFDASTGQGASMPAALEADGTRRSVVRLRELRLGGVLDISRNVFDPGPGDPPPSLYLQKSTIRDNDVTVHRNAFAGRVFVIEVEGNKVTIAQNSFSQFFEVSGSQIYSIRTYDNHFFGAFSITGNRIASSLLLDRDYFDGEATRLLDVRSNQVGHDLRFGPRTWPAERFTVDFSFNQIVGPFSFFWPVMNRFKTRVIACDGTEPPQRWRGGINFLGTTVETSMRLVEGCVASVAAPLQPFTLALDGPRQRSAVCKTGETQPATGLDLTLVEVGVLHLDIAPGCQYAWRGPGLAFRYFGAPYSSPIDVVNGDAALPAGNEDHAIDHLIEWLGDLEAPDPEVFFFVSNYLRSRGKLNDSRDWLESAKQETYRPKAADSTLQQLSDGIVYAALWPAGFGAKPERVILCMAVLWLVGLAIYTLHHRGWIGGAGVFLRYLRTPPPPGLTYELPDRGGGGPGLREQPMAFAPGSSVFVEPGRVGRAAASAAAAFTRSWERERQRLAAPDTPLDSVHTDKHGFVTTSKDRLVRHFSLWSYALDVTLPIVPLGRFGVFVPDHAVVRAFSYLHHMLGWWLGALFIGALTIL